MADIRINALATTASSTASDDFLAVDGSANGTRKLSAYSPTFGGNLTVSGTGTSSVAGTLLVATTTNSSNGAVQLATHTTSAGGIGFGTDVSLYRFTTGQVVLDGTTGNSAVMWFAESGTRKCYLQSNAGNLNIYSTGGSVVLASNNTTALTLDSSQNATFASAVTINGKATFSYSGSNGPVINRTDGSGYLTFNKSNGVNGVQLSANGAGELNFYTGDGVTYAGKISSSLASFVGAIAIGNTVQTAVSVASTHKVTISIGGTTYYLLATNV